MDTELLFNTHKFNAKDGAAKIAKMMATREEWDVMYAHEQAHHKKPRKGILDAIEEKIGEWAAVEEVTPSVLVIGRKEESRLKPEEAEEKEVAVEEVAEEAPAPEPEPEVEAEEEGILVYESVPQPMEEAPDPVPDTEPYEPPEGEEAEEIYGMTVLVVDDTGRKHEAIVVRDVTAEERPVIVAMKDGYGTERVTTFDATGKRPRSWALK